MSGQSIPAFVYFLYFRFNRVSFHQRSSSSRAFRAASAAWRAPPFTPRMFQPQDFVTPTLRANRIALALC